MTTIHAPLLVENDCFMKFESVLGEIVVSFGKSGRLNVKRSYRKTQNIKKTFSTKKQSVGICTSKTKLKDRTSALERFRKFEAVLGEIVSKHQKNKQ
jgi:hypothetical protein